MLITYEILITLGPELHLKCCIKKGLILDLDLERIIVQIIATSHITELTQNYIKEH